MNEKKLILVQEPCECPFRYTDDCGYRCKLRRYGDDSGDEDCQFDSFPDKCPLIAGFEYTVKFKSKLLCGGESDED